MGQLEAFERSSIKDASFRSIEQDRRIRRILHGFQTRSMVFLNSSYTITSTWASNASISWMMVQTLLSATFPTMAYLAKPLPSDTKILKRQRIERCSPYSTTTVANWGSNHTWMGFIDADESFDTPGPQSLIEILKSFESNTSVGAPRVNWHTHTSNDLLKRPPSVRKNFTTCIVDSLSPNGDVSDNLHIKSIVKTNAYIDPESPHPFHLKDNAMTVGEHGDIITDFPRRSPFTRDRIVLHHYGVKNKEEDK